MKNFTAGPEWKQFEFAINSFGGADAHDLAAIVFAAGLPAGNFDLYLDEVRID
jgi:hypothetical protein